MSQKKVDAFELYKEGMDAFDKNDFFFASKKFSDAELNFDKVELLPNLQLCQLIHFMELIFMMKR